MNTITKFQPARYLEPEVLLRQIGMSDLLAVSGGRYEVIEVNDTNVVVLPVAYGYSVRIWLDGNDTYVVERMFGKANPVVKKQWIEIYADQVGEIAYQASCYLDGE